MANDQKGCQNLEIPLKPLNLHQKISEIDDDIRKNLILNTIKFQHKNLDISEGLQWIKNILPDVPSIVDQSKESIQFIYKSSFVSSYIIIQLTNPNEEKTFGELSVQTDNYSVLTIIKDQISTNASQQKMQINIESEFDDDSVFKILDNLNPLIEDQYKIAQQNQLIDGLKELQINVSMHVLFSHTF